MEYSVRFKLEVKNNVYVSKKNALTEPYYQISAIIRINHRSDIKYSLGFSAQKSAWFGKPQDALKGDGNRSCGIHKNHTAKKKSRLIQYSEVNRAIDLVEGKLLSLSTKVEDISKEELFQILNVELGKTCKPQQEITQSTNEVPDENPLWVLANLYCIDPKVSSGRNGIRLNTMRHFKRFEENRGEELVFPECSALLLTEFEEYLWQDGRDPNRYAHIKNPRNRPRKKGINTISKIMRVTKCFFNWCEDKYEITNLGNVGKYKVPSEIHAEPIALTREEKQQLLNHPFDNKELETIRDLFYLQCSIGCRVSGFFALKHENFVFDEEAWVIKYLPIKTKKENARIARIPLTDNALAIVHKHKTEMQSPQTSLFDFPKHSQTFNNKIKEVMKEANLNRIVEVLDVDGNLVFKPLYDVGKSKYGRSTFIDMLVGNGESDTIISTMSGHVPGSKAFHRYHNSHKAQQQNKAIAMLD